MNKRNRKRLLKAAREMEHGREGLFKTWPRPAAQRSLLERALRKVWLFRWDRHQRAHALTGIQWCQSIGYRDEKVARLFPIRNWVQKELPHKLRVQGHRWNALKWKVKHRLPPHRYHVIKPQTLVPGYYEVGTRMLHATFHLITDFVEISLANRYTVGKDETEPKWHKGRSPEAGLRYLDWEINEPNCKHGPYPTQADFAKIKRDLYLWWTVDRPARIEPYSVYKLLKKKDTASKRYKERGLWGVLNGGDDSRRASHCMHALEQFYQEEDKEMLEKAASIMHSF